MREKGTTGPRGLPEEGERLTHWEGEPVAVWTGLWQVPRLEVFRRISSTNDRAWELARDGAATLSTVLAEEQTAGRGRGGAGWEAGPESSLLISFLLRPPAPGGRSVAPLILGIAVARAVEDVTGLSPMIKWPNDVLLRGRKAAGILCEAGRGAGPRDVVAGVGINVRQRLRDFSPVLRERATSLEMLAREPVSRPRLAGRLVARVRELFDPGPERITGELARELDRRDALRGRRLRLEDGLRGRALGVGPDGGLLLETAWGERRIVAGGVRDVEEADF